MVNGISDIAMPLPAAPANLLNPLPAPSVSSPSPFLASNPGTADRFTQRLSTDSSTAYRDAIATLRTAGARPANAVPTLQRGQPDAKPQNAGGGWLDHVGGFVKGVGEGAVDGVTGMVKGVGTLAKGAYQVATSSTARQSELNTVVNDAKSVGRFAETAVTDPAKAAGQVGGAASSAWNQVATAYDNAAASGHGAEFIGKIFGQGAVLVGAAVVPGGAADVADAGRVAEVARAATAAGDVGKAATLSESAGKAGTVLNRAAAGAADGGSGQTVTAYRVEGAGNARIVVGENGSVAVPTVLTKSGAERNLYLNFGDRSRAGAFLQQRLASFPDSAIKQFDVPRSFVDDLRANAIPESQRSSFPLSPVIADPTKAADQFGLSAPQINELRQVIIAGSGKANGG